MQRNAFYKDLKQINLEEIFELTKPQISYERGSRVIIRGTSASPGIASGKLIVRNNYTSNPAGGIIVMEKLTQQDYQIMRAAAGLVVLNGGPTSPGILLAKSLEVPCVTANQPLIIKGDALIATGRKVLAKTGDPCVLDAGKGTLRSSTARIAKSVIDEKLNHLIRTVNSTRFPRVLSFSLRPETIAKLAGLGIGLAIRGEDLLAFSHRSLNLFRQVLLSRGKKTRGILKKLTAIQTQYYHKLLAANGTMPCVIRLFDPPLSEFLPVSIGDNKMLGHRGCRIAITNPEIYEMQLRAIFSALAELLKQGLDCRPHLSIPFVIDPSEVKIIKTLILKTKGQVERKYKMRLTCKIGAAIETPRGAYLANPIAREVDYLGFGTNDLTQLVMGISRTDHNSFLGRYMDRKILKNNPFSRIDEAVIALIKQTIRSAGRKKLDYFIAVHDYRDVAILKNIFPQNLHIVCSPQIAPLVKLAVIKSQLQ